MLRLSAEGIALFLVPFFIYALLLLLGRRFPVLRGTQDHRALAVVAGFGVALMIVGLLGLGFFGERYRGAYRPAHIENGRLVPGHME